MATINKRGNKWRAEVRRKTKDGTVYRSRTFIHKETATKWAREQEISFERNESPESLKLVREAIAKYLREVSIRKKGAKWESVRFEAFLKHSIADKRLCDLRPSDFSDWREERLKSVTGATVIRELTLWSGLFSACIKDWGWLKENPIKGIRKPSSGKPRNRVLSDDEIDRLLLYFNSGSDRKKQVGTVMLIAIETGMRLGEILNLEKSDIFSNYLIIQDSKNNDSRQVPLTKKAATLLESVPFTVSRDHASMMFTRAVKSLNMGDLRFHDTRHTAATRLARKIQMLDLCRMFGWRDPRHAMIYYNPTASEIAARLESE